MKKQIMLAITTILLILSTTFAVFAEETEEWQYEVRDGKAVLTSYLGSDAVVAIPDKIESYTVIGLEGTFKENRFVQEITIPDGIEFLGEKTFYRCRNLETVELPDSIVELGWLCFSESAIKEIYIPNRLEELPSAAFSKCENLEKVDFSSSNLKSIEQFAFMGCSSLCSAELPETVTELGEGIFYICNNIEIFTIPENIESISYINWPVVSGENLRQIINLSDKEFDKAIYFSGTDFNYAWFVTENGYELAEYLPANSTIYRRKKDSAQKYIDKYLKILSEVNVSMEEVNTKEKMLEFVISKKPESDLSSIISEVEIRSFYAATEGNKYNPNGSKGNAAVLIKATNSVIENDTAQEYITINIAPVPYKEEQKPSEEESTDNKEEETTSSNNNDSIKKYIEQVLKSIPSAISMEEVNTEDAAVTYSKSFFDKTLIEKYNLDISATGFQKATAGTRNDKFGRRGSFRISVWSEDLQEYTYHSITINPTVYVRNENDFLAEEYANRYKEVLKEIDESGIIMTIVNSPEEAKQYIEKFAPKDKNENVTYEIKIFVDEGPILFRKAEAGTKTNKNGKNGSCPVGITVKNSLCEEDIKEVREVVPIIATPYVESSSDDSSSDDEDDDRSSHASSSSSSRPNVTIISTTLVESNKIRVSKTSVISGTWEQVGDKWKLKLENGSYANTQWALVKGEWYLLGQNDYMLNGWQMVNDKWYLLAKDGHMLSGWQLVDGKWYYMEQNGEMVTGWRWVADKCYYMDSTGAMMANTTTPDGYRVNENGEWVE